MTKLPKISGQECVKALFKVDVYFKRRRRTPLTDTLKNHVYYEINKQEFRDEEQ